MEEQQFHPGSRLKGSLCHLYLPPERKRERDSETEAGVKNINTLPW